MEDRSSKMTIDRLAEISQREFVAVHGKIDGVQKEMRERFDDVDSRLDGLDKKFDSLAEILRLMRDDLKEIKENVMTINLTIRNFAFASSD
jgi:DNA-binding ferritin-like protein